MKVLAAAHAPLPLASPRYDLHAVQFHLIIAGMHSVHAKRAAWMALAGVPGVRSADVAMGGARIACDGPVDESTLREAIESVGLTVISLTRELPLA